MAGERFLAVVGIDEEDTARLRLLLRLVAPRLEQRWRWGTEENADLVVVNPEELQGQIARNRAFSSGRRCAVYSTSEPLRNGESRLGKPLKADDLVEVLSSTTANAAELATTSPVQEQKDDFYDLETFTPDFALDKEEHAETPSENSERPPTQGLDELFKPDSERNKPRFAVDVKLSSETRYQRTSSPSRRSEQRIADSLAGMRKSTEKPEGINMTAGGSDGYAATASRATTLLDYLRKPLLGGPSLAALAGAPELTLDPKAEAFHSAGELAELAAYCKQPLSGSAWRPVTRGELARLRQEQPARPYAQLIWLDALLKSEGRLARHLDPGGHYRLREWPATADAFPNHHAIVDALSQPAKLNEIAGASGAPMAEVFDVVNAYDAIGLIEVKSRIRAPAPAPSRGLLSRLRKPFGKG